MRYALLDDGHEVVTARDGVEALTLARQQRPDVVVMDIVMPKLDGIELCHELRRDARLASVPILFVSGRQEVGDRVRGLDEGGDDYLCKPFDLAELKARVRALLRRTGGPSGEAMGDPRVLVAGDLLLNLNERSLHVDGRPVVITPTELALLSFFMSHQGEVFTGRQLLEQVWGYAPGTSDPGLVRWHMRNLRAKIEPDPANARYVRTVPRYGYMLDRRLEPQACRPACAARPSSSDLSLRGSTRRHRHKSGDGSESGGQTDN